MCGIAGYLSFSTPTRKKVLRKMTDEIFYRGPDSFGEYYSESLIAALGIRRLSIIDLTTGDQPIKNEDGSVVVVFNGEIYNYLDLKKDLLSKGHRFKTKSDTEILVHLYEEYGEQMVKKLNGMFAFAIWDEKKTNLYIARDRAGIKPLYYYTSGDLFVFGSELKTILKHPEFRKKIDLNSLNLYCYLGYIPSDKSIFNGIKKLLPGHTLTISKSGVKIKKYFDIDFNFEIEEESLNDLLRNAVTSQLQADVPVGVFLSGGLDSSLISYYITESKKKMKSFSISFEEKSFDESKYARIVAEKLGTEHYQEVFNVSEVPDLYQEIISKLDEPFADASLFPTYKVSQLAKKHVKVALSGDGGDELFGGYPTYQGQIIGEMFKYFPKSIIDTGILLTQILPSSDKNYPKKTLAKILANAIKKAPFERQIYMMRTFFLGENIVRKVPNLKSIKSQIPTMENINITTKAQVIDFYTYMRDDFLYKSDRASMFNSLEVRVPYLDNNVIDFAFSKNKRHVNLLKTKILLRRLAMEKLDLPEIANRPKKGFGIPTSKWLKEELKDFGYEILKNKKMENYIDKNQIKHIWEDHQKGRQNNGGVIWMLIILSGWFNKWA